MRTLYPECGDPCAARHHAGVAAESRECRVLRPPRAIHRRIRHRTTRQGPTARTMVAQYRARHRRCDDDCQKATFEALSPPASTIASISVRRCQAFGAKSSTIWRLRRRRYADKTHSDGRIDGVVYLVLSKSEEERIEDQSLGCDAAQSLDLYDVDPQGNNGRALDLFTATWPRFRFDLVPRSRSDPERTHRDVEAPLRIVRPPRPASPEVTEDCRRKLHRPSRGTAREPKACVPTRSIHRFASHSFRRRSDTPESLSHLCREHAVSIGGRSAASATNRSSIVGSSRRLAADLTAEATEYPVQPDIW